MTASEELTKLAARAKEAEDRAAAAWSKARSELEQDVESARATAQAQADTLREAADVQRSGISEWWGDVHREWHKRAAEVSEDIDRKRAQFDSERAKKRAQQAESDAAFAVACAFAAIEEAEYAVLAASLAKMDADELIAGARA